eukprot:330586_1
MVFVSIRKPNCYTNEMNNSYFTTSIISVTTVEVIIQIIRIETEIKSTWTNNVFLDYIIFDPSLQTNNALQTYGKRSLSINGETYFESISISVDNPNFVVNEPVILIQVVSSDTNPSLWVTTSGGNNNSSFMLSMQQVTNYTNNKIEIYYWAFERITLRANYMNIPETMIFKGNILDEVWQFDRDYENNINASTNVFLVFNDKAGNSTDLHYIQNNIYLQPTFLNVDTITSWNVDMETDHTLYPCQNSLEYIARKYNPYCDERMACNYWPCTSQAYIKNNKNDMRFGTIMNRAHGLGSIKNGEYNQMIQRRCADINDDWFPLGCCEPTHGIEPINYVLYDNSESVSYFNRRFSLLQQYKPIQFWSIYNGNINDYKKKYLLKYKAMNVSLPNNIHLLDLRYVYKNNSGLVMQLWNMFQTNENKKYSQNVTVNLQSIINTNIIKIENVTEMQLSSFIPINDLNRMSWNYVDENGNVKILNKDNNYIKNKRKKEMETMNVVMNPRNIRTFVVNQKIN